MKGYPDFLAFDADDIWVLNEDKVEKISVKKDTATLSVNIPGTCGAMIVDDGSLWVASCKEETIYRINKTNGTIQAIIKTGVADRTGEISLASGAGSVWILSDKEGILTRINAKNNKIQAQIKVLPNSFCAVFGFNAVWISNTNNNSIQRVDPKANKVVATIAVGAIPRFLAAGEKGVWTLNQKEGTVTHIDPATNKLKATIDTKVPGSYSDIATGGGLVWVRSAKGRLLQTIDAVSDKIKTIYTPVAGSGAVRVSKNYVWVTAHDINALWILKKPEQ